MKGSSLFLVEWNTNAFCTDDMSAAAFQLRRSAIFVVKAPPKSFSSSVGAAYSGMPKNPLEPSIWNCWATLAWHMAPGYIFRLVENWWIRYAAPTELGKTSYTCLSYKDDAPNGAVQP